MLQILSITAPVFLPAGIGWAFAHAGLLGPEGGRSLGAVTIWAAMPAMILRAFVDNGVTEMLDWPMMLGYGAPSALLLLAGYGIYARLGRGPARAGMAAAGGVAPNSGFFGFPVVTLAFGQAAGATMLANAMIVENVVLIALDLALAAGRRRGGAAAGWDGRSARRWSPACCAIRWCWRWSRDQRRRWRGWRGWRSGSGLRGCASAPAGLTRARRRRPNWLRSPRW